MDKKKEKIISVSSSEEQNEFELLSFEYCNVRLEKLCRKIKTQNLKPRKLEYNS